MITDTCCKHCTNEHKCKRSACCALSWLVQIADGTAIPSPSAARSFVGDALWPLLPRAGELQVPQAPQAGARWWVSVGRTPAWALGRFLGSLC